MPRLTQEALHEILREMRCDIKEIKAQTIKTNGRVTSLEIWRGVITGGLLVIVALIVPLLLRIL